MLYRQNGINSKKREGDLCTPKGNFLITKVFYRSDKIKKINTKIETLQKEVWGYSANLETHTVETHIYRLRKKINEKFNDENFLVSLKDGYKI